MSEIDYAANMAAAVAQERALHGEPPAPVEADDVFKKLRAAATKKKMLEQRAELKVLKEALLLNRVQTAAYEQRIAELESDLLSHEFVADLETNSSNL